MKVSALHKNARVTPRKARRWREVVLGKPVAEAKAQLAWLQGKPVKLLEKVLDSAVANAVNNFSLEEKELFVSGVEINEGIKFKRWQPASKGMAHPFRKETCHIKVILTDKAGKEKKKIKTKTKIDTLTADRFEKLRREKKVEEVEVAQEKQTAPAPGEEVREDKEMQVWKKERMLQMGGNKKQAQRRKSK